jgi:hypothetical protein
MNLKLNVKNKNTNLYSRFSILFIRNQRKTTKPFLSLFVALPCCIAKFYCVMSSLHRLATSLVCLALC